MALGEVVIVIVWEQLLELRNAQFPAKLSWVAVINDVIIVLFKIPDK